MPRHDDRLVAHRRHVGAAGGARAHHQRDLRDPARRELGLVEEDAAEVVAIGEDLVLERQERAARVDEIEARQPVLERDLLRSQVLLDGHRVVGAALDRRVVRDDHRVDSLDATDAGHDSRTRRLVVVEAIRRKRVQLEEGAPRIDEPIDPLANGKLAALPMAGDRALVAPRAVARQDCHPRTQVVHQGAHRHLVGAERLGTEIDAAAQDGHSPPIIAGGSGERDERDHLRDVGGVDDHDADDVLEGRLSVVEQVGIGQRDEARRFAGDGDRPRRRAEDGCCRSR